MQTGIHAMKRDANVYLRWAGQRKGERFETVGSGPWGVMVDGNMVLLDHVDDVELERDRSYLEKNQGVTDMVLQMSYPVDGKCETWHPVVNAKRGVETGLDVGRNVWTITELPKGDYYTHRVEAQATNVEIVNALSQQYGVVENWCEGHTAGGLLLAVNFRLPA